MYYTFSFKADELEPVTSDLQNHQKKQALTD